MDTYDKFMYLIENLGEDTVLSEVYNYFGTYEIDNFIESVSDDYDIELEDDEE